MLNQDAAEVLRQHLRKFNWDDDKLTKKLLEMALSEIIQLRLERDECMRYIKTTHLATKQIMKRYGVITNEEKSSGD